jgi:hypothetical protein
MEPKSFRPLCTCCAVTFEFSRNQSVLLVRAASFSGGHPKGTRGLRPPRTLFSPAGGGEATTGGRKERAFGGQWPTNPQSREL